MFSDLMALIPRDLIDVIRIPAGRYLLPKVKFKGNRGKGGVPALLVLHRSIRSYNRPERPRHWHNPADPIQAARIEAAAHERARKAEARETVIFRGWDYNKAHEGGSNLDPYRIASA